MMDILHRPSRPIGSEIGLYALAEDRRVNLVDTGTIPRFNAYKKITATSGMTSCILRYAVSHPKGMPGYCSMRLLFPEVKRDLPLHPIRFVVLGRLNTASTRRACC